MIRDVKSASPWPLLLAFVALPYFFNYSDELANPNELSRVYLARAIVENGSFKIGEQLKKHGDRADKAVFEGEAYSDKAPGLALLAVPPLAVAKGLAALFGSDLGLRASLRWLRFAVVQLPAALFLLWLYYFLLRRQVRAHSARFAVLVFALGSPFAIYSTQFQAHAVAGMALMGAMMLLADAERWPSTHALGAAGFLAGLAMAVEYSLLPAVIILGLYAINRAREPRELLPFVVLSVSWVLALGLYHYACFGNPLATGYRFSHDAQIAQLHQSIFGLQAPSFGAMYSLLLGKANGLLAFSPLFVLAPLGLIGMLSRGRMSEVVVIGAIAFVHFVMVSGHPLWSGDATIGPRHLVPVLPLLVWPLARFIDGLSSVVGGALLAGVLGVASLLIFGLCVSAPAFPGHFENGVRDLAWFLFRDGVFPASLGRVFGLAGFAAVVPFALILALAAAVVAMGGSSEVGGLRRLVAVSMLASALLFWRLSWSPVSDPRARFLETLAIERRVEKQGGELAESVFARRLERAPPAEAPLRRGQLATSVGDSATALDAYRQLFKPSRR